MAQDDVTLSLLLLNMSHHFNDKQGRPNGKSNQDTILFCMHGRYMRGSYKIMEEFLLATVQCENYQNTIRIWKCTNSMYLTNQKQLNVGDSVYIALPVPNPDPNATMIIKGDILGSCPLMIECSPHKLSYSDVQPACGQVWTTTNCFVLVSPSRLNSTVRIEMIEYTPEGEYYRVQSYFTGSRGWVSRKCLFQSDPPKKFLFQSNAPKYPAVGEMWQCCEYNYPHLMCLNLTYLPLLHGDKVIIHATAPPDVHSSYGWSYAECSDGIFGWIDNRFLDKFLL